MTNHLYLAISTSSNNVLLASDSGVSIRDPFRGDPGAGGATVVNPFLVSAYEFSVQAPVTTPSSGGTAVGKAAITEITFHLQQDPNTAALLLNLCKGLQLNYVDLLIVRSEDQPAILKPYTAFAFNRAFVTDLTWSGSTGDAQAGQSLSIVATQASVGWAPLRPGGSYGPFTYNTWDFSRQQQVN